MKRIRNEIKHYITQHDYLILYNNLKQCMEIDPNRVKNNGLVRSLYFDTLHNTNFHEKTAGIEKRKKYRLRIYDLNTKKVKFEIKNKLNNQIFKETAIITKEDAIKIQNGDYEVLLKYNNPILNKIYFEFKKKYYKPVVLVEYIREPFIFEVNNVRITFDKYLKCNTTDLDLFQKPLMKDLVKKNLVIMEIKYNKFLPENIKKLLQIPAFEKTAISKYCISRIERFKI